jgi:hypothetical protein
MTAHRRAVLERNAAALVDEKAQQPPAVRRLDVDQLISKAADRRLDDFFEAQTKNGPKPICENKTESKKPGCSKAFEV